MSIVQKLFSFHGRLRRRDFWLLSIAINVAAMTIGPAFALAAPTAFRPGSKAALGLQLVVFVLTIWPTLAVVVKRWHDRNRTGWWVLMFFVPTVGGVVALINLGILDGAHGCNRFGSSPKGLDVEDEPAPV